MTQSRPTLSGRPGGIVWLMGHELRLYWRRGKMRPRSGLIIAAILLGVWSLITWTVFHRFGEYIPPPPFSEGAGAGFALMAVSMIIVFMASVMTSGAILGAVDAIYTRNDLDLLLSSPVSPWRVLSVRASAIAIGALPVYAGFLGPPLLWLTLYSSPFWLTSLIFLLTLAFVATGLALLIVTGLFRLMGPRNTRVLAQVVSALTGGAIFILFQWFNLSFTRSSNFQDQAEVFRMIETMNINPQAFWLLPARAMTGDVPSTLVWVVFAAIVFPAGVYIFSRSFVSDAAAASAMGRKSRVADGRVAAVRGGVMASIIRKELRLLARDPLLLSQIGLQLVYIFPLALVLVRPGSDFRMTEAAFAPALTLLSSTLAGSLIWITASAEDAPDLIASAPAPASLIDRAKLFAAIAPVLALMTIPLLALLVRDAWAGAWATGGVVAGAVFAALIGLWRRNPGSRRDFVRRRQGGSTLTALGKAFTGLSLAATAGAGAYGFPWLAIVPAIIGLAILGALYKPAPKFAEA